MVQRNQTKNDEAKAEDHKDDVRIVPAPTAQNLGVKTSTEATKEAVTEQAKNPVTVAVPGTGLVDPTRDASGQIIRPDEAKLADPIVFASGYIVEGPSGDANIAGMRREDPDASTTPQGRIDAALKEAGLDKSTPQPPMDSTAYKAREAAKVRLAAEAAQLDLTIPGGRFLVGGVLVDCNGRKIEDAQAE